MLINTNRTLFSILTLAVVTLCCSQALIAAPFDQVKGNLIITVADYFTQHRSETSYFIKDQSPAGRTYELHFVTQPKGGLRTGMTVTGRGRINGRFLEGAEITAAESARVVSPQSAVSALTGNIIPVTGVRTTLLYVLQSATTPNTFTNSQINNTMFAQTGPSVNTLYQANSYGSVSFAGTVVGPYTIAVPTSCNPSDLNSIQSQADQAATAAGVDFSSYPYRIYMMPNEMTRYCGFGGVSYLGCCPGHSWINSGFYWTSGPGEYDVDVALAHELGHQLNMQHAQGLLPNGGLVEYGDNSCNMGDEDYNVVGFNVPHLIELGWLPLANVQQVSAGGTYQVAFAEQQTTAVQALQIVVPGTADPLYVSYRQPQGVNANLPSGFLGGASIQYWQGSNYKSQLATNNAPYAGALADGQTYTSPNGYLSIQQIAHTSANVTVNVTMIPDTAPTIYSAVGGGTASQPNIVVTGINLGNGVGSQTAGHVLCNSYENGAWNGWLAPTVTSVSTTADGTQATLTLQSNFTSVATQCGVEISFNGKTSTADTGIDGQTNPAITGVNVP